MGIIRKILDSDIKLTIMEFIMKARFKYKFLYVLVCMILFYINMKSGWWLTQWVEKLYINHFSVEHFNPDLLNTKVSGIYAIYWYICYYAAIPLCTFIESSLMFPYKGKRLSFIRLISYIILIGTGCYASYCIINRYSYDVIRIMFLDNVYLHLAFLVLLIAGSFSDWAESRLEKRKCDKIESGKCVE